MLNILLKYPLSIFLFLLIGSFANAQSWKGPYYTLAASGTGAETGFYFSTASVNGFPAIAYTDETHQNIMFVRALDSNGTNWNTPQIIDTFNVSANGITLAVINGNPAIAYGGGGNSGNAQLRYRRANDANGTSWQDAVIVDQNPIVYSLSMTLVNGFPAIAYACSLIKKLKYVRAGDMNGATWTSPVLVDSSGYACEFPVLKIANGNPAIGYYNSTDEDLMYVRAQNVSGTSWGLPDTVQYSGETGYPFSMEIVNSRPAFAFYDLTTTTLYYLRALNAAGSSWPNPIVLDGFSGSTGISLHIISGKPAVTFSSSVPGDFYYMRATNVNGSTWGTTVSVGDTGLVQTSKNDLAFMNGKPKIVYRQQNPVKFYFQSALDSMGNTWDIPFQVQNRGAMGTFSSLQIVKGIPAFSFYDSIHSDLCYVRASDTSGLVPWQLPVVVDANAGSGFGSKMQIVKERPAIAYISYNSNIFKLKFVRAANGTGTAWSAPVLLDSFFNPNPNQYYVSMAIINDTPAVSYFNPASGYLMYIKANNPYGNSWSMPVIVDSTGYTGRFNSLSEVNGRPAIAYYEAISKQLKYVRADNGTGSLWGNPLALNTSGDVGAYASLGIVNGFPAITASGLYFRAADINGITWNSSVTLGTGGIQGSLVIADGKPAIAYMSGNKLVFKIASDMDGNTWGIGDTIYEGYASDISVTTNSYKAEVIYFSLSEATALFFSKTLGCIPPGAAITPGGPASFCEGDSVVLNTIFAANRTYQWKKGGANISGATLSAYTATLGGIYKVTVTNTLTGCSRTTTQGTAVTVYSLPNATITPQGPTSFCAGDSVILKANSGGGLSYQWKKNGINISGATNINYVADSAGFYKVKVTNSNSCKKISGGVTVTVPCRDGNYGLSNEEKEEDFAAIIYPNPASDDLVINPGNEKNKKTTVRVFDSIGKLILSDETCASQFRIGIAQLEAGVYTVIVTNEDLSKSIMLIKN